MNYLGDFNVGDTVRILWNTNDSNGASITRATNGTVSVYQNGNIAQSVAGIVDTEDFDGLTGVHLVTIDTSADGTFYAAGRDFAVVLSGATIDTRIVNAVIGQFSILARSALRPTAANRTLDVSATGEAGIDWANVGNPTAALNLANTTLNIGSGGIVNTSLAASAITAIQTGLSTHNAADVWAVATRTLSTAGIQAMWDALTSNLTVVGSVGKRIADMLDVTISSRLAAASYTVPPTAIANADALLDRTDAIEIGATPRQSFRLMLSALAGKLSGAATTTVTIRNAIADSKNRIIATVDIDGNRTGVTTDVS